MSKQVIGILFVSFLSSLQHKYTHSRDLYYGEAMAVVRHGQAKHSDLIVVGRLTLPYH